MTIAESIAAAMAGATGTTTSGVTTVQSETLKTSSKSGSGIEC